MMKMAEEVELANYRWWDEPEKVQQKKFDPMNNIAVTLTDNKRYTKVNKYEALLVKKDSTESIKYKERLIDYDKDYESYNPYLDWYGPEIFVRYETYSFQLTNQILVVQYLGLKLQHQKVPENARKHQMVLCDISNQILLVG